MREFIVWKRTLKMIMLIFLAGILVGCNDSRKVMPGTQKEINKKENSLEADTSLLNLRQSMNNTSELFAVAYLGYVQDFYNESAEVWMENACPQLVREFPFVKKIPENRIIGEKTGELYCIVPRDESATVAVNRIIDSWEYGWEVDEVLYRSETGEPILVFCNSGDSIPDVQITVTNGFTVTYYPWISEAGKTVLPVGEEAIVQAKDFTSYDELSLSRYRLWTGYNFAAPKAESLKDTSWIFGYVGENGDYTEYFMELFADGDLRFTWFYGETMEIQEEYQGSWSIASDEKETYLKINMARTGGILYSEGEDAVYVQDQYPILFDSNEEFLLLGNGMNTKEMPLPVENMEIITFMKSYG